MKPNMFECEKCGQPICEHLDEANEPEIRPMLVLNTTNVKLPTTQDPNPFFSSVIIGGSRRNSPLVSRQFISPSPISYTATVGGPRIVRSLNQERSGQNSPLVNRSNNQ